MRFRVTWEMDFDADDVLSAAQQAREVQLDPESVATVFVVQEVREGSARDMFGPKMQVDLETGEVEAGDGRSWL